jgi:hypothetical protein
MHLNKCVLIGRVGEGGLKLTYDDRATPTCAFTLEVDELGRRVEMFSRACNPPWLGL